MDTERLRAVVRVLLHDTGMIFILLWIFRTDTRTGVNWYWYRYKRSDGLELVAIWLVPAGHFVQDYHVNKQIQSQKWEPGRARTGMKVTPVSCKHPLRCTMTLELAFSDSDTKEQFLIYPFSRGLGAGQIREVLDLQQCIPPPKTLWFAIRFFAFSDSNSLTSLGFKPF